MLVGAWPEREALVDSNIANAQLDRLVDELEADLIIKEKSVAVGPPLRIGFPRGDLVPRGQLVHRIDIARRIRIDTSVNVKPVCAVEFLNDTCRGSGFFDRERFIQPCRWNEREHHQVGIRIHEHILDEFVLADTVQIIDPASSLRGAARLRLGHAQRARSRW